MAESVADRLNALLKDAREGDISEAQAAYAAELRSLSRQLAARFKELTALTAAAAWEPPNVDDVLAISARTARIRSAQRSMLERLAGTLNGIDGIDFNLTHPVVQELLNELGRRAEALGEGLRTPVANAIARGWAEGRSVPQTAALIRSSVGSQVGYRATMLARTDLIGLSNGAGHWAVDQVNAAATDAGREPVIKSRTWTNAGDSRVRPTHQDAEGQTVPMDQPFYVGGHYLSYPGDPFGPTEEVAQCRCVEVYNESLPVAKPTEDKMADGIPGRSDTMNRLLGTYEDTQSRYKTPGGRYTPEREQLHRQIAEHFIAEGRAHQKREALFMSGGSGAGKSTVMRELRELGRTPRDAVRIDPDAIKEMLPEYQQLLDVRDRGAAMAVHEESSDIAKQILDEAMERKFNVIIDGTGDSAPGKFVAKLQKQRQAGYDVDVVVVDLPTDEAVQRALARYERSGRYVPEKVIREIHRDVSARFQEWSDLPDVRSWEVWANEGRPPRLIANYRNGAYNIHDGPRFRQFMRKADEAVDSPNVKLAQTISKPRMLKKEIKDEVYDMLAVLDGNLPQKALEKLEHLREKKLPVRTPLNIEGGAWGQYWRTTIAGEKEHTIPREIKLARTAPHQGLTLMHEVGHFIDNAIFAGRNRIYGSFDSILDPDDVGLPTGVFDMSPVMREFIQRALQTREIKALQARQRDLTLRLRTVDTPESQKKIIAETLEHLAYLLSPQEIWARAFSQFMLERYGGPVTRREIIDKLDFERESMRLPTQWGEDWSWFSQYVELVLRDSGLLGDLPVVTASGVIDPRLVAALESRPPLRRLVARHSGFLSDEVYDLLIRQSRVERGDNINARLRHTVKDATRAIKARRARRR